MQVAQCYERGWPLRVGALPSVWFVRALCRAVRPLAAGEPGGRAWRFVPTVSRAARPSAGSDLVVAVEQRYALDLRTSEAGGRTASEEGSVLNTEAQTGRVEQAPNPAIERTANGVQPWCTSGEAVPPLSAAHGQR
jgi:hypothetical protein